MDPDVLADIEQRLQPKLLAFRLENYAQVKPLGSVWSCLTPPVRDIAHALALPLLGDAELERELLEIIRPHDAQAKVDRRGEPEWIVMTALYARIHIHDGYDYLTVKEITSPVDVELARNGESYRLTPRKVGAILRSLGFQTQSLGCQGRGLRLSKGLIRSIHTTAKNLGVRRADMHLPEYNEGQIVTCRDCEETGLLVDHDGRRMRYVEYDFKPEPQEP